MSRAVLSIGSNLGDRLAHLRGAVTAFAPWLVAASSVFETAPWGLAGQPDFLNAALLVDDPGARPLDWLKRAQAAEHAAERVPTIRWGPRTLDVDVIDVDGLEADDPTLTLPHPRAAQRAFVLLPWAEIDPSPTVLDLVRALPADERDSVRHCPELTLR
jgi:2-amino-4-hydroxy-6-hydroxymethyldihydropteridine diphosphokinase